MKLSPRTRSIAAGAALCLSLGSHAAEPAPAASELVQVQGAYVRAVPPGQPNSALFLDLTNQGDTDQVLVDAKSTASKVVELHTHREEDGMMKMRRVDKIALPAGETVRLQPGGLHIMLIGLERQLAAGDEVEITLVYGDGGNTTLTAPVKRVQQTMHHH